MSVYQQSVVGRICNSSIILLIQFILDYKSANETSGQQLESCAEWMEIDCLHGSNDASAYVWTHCVSERTLDA